MQYIRAFFKAIQLTLAGETVTTPASRYPNLQKWLDASRQKLDHLQTVIASSNIDEAQQKAIVLELDGRPWSMHLILSSLKFHLETEFPSLMSSVIEHNLTTLYALHFDDKYRIGQLVASDQVPEQIRPALNAFADQFVNIPSSTDP